MPTIVHPLPPFLPPQASVLILGTMPSPLSRQTGFYYGHPQNRFWRVLGGVFEEPVPNTLEEKQALLCRHGVALWDTLSSCEIKGAADSTIHHPVPNDIRPLLVQAPIRAIFTTGAKAAEYYRQLIEPTTGIQAVPLPSTSPANCRFHTVETLIEAYRALLPYCEENTTKP